MSKVSRNQSLGRSLDQGLTLAAFERAPVVAAPHIHTCDQGVPYASPADVERRKQLDIQLSTAAIGAPREDGYAARTRSRLARTGGVAV